jgi:chromosome segregation ATPase
MSNHGTVVARPRPDDRWKRTCEADLDRCYTSCRDTLARTEALGSGMARLSKAIAPLRNLDLPQVRAAARELDQATSRVRELQGTLHRLHQESRELDRTGSARTAEAARTSRRVEAGLAAERSRLDQMRREVAATQRQTAQLGQRLTGALRQATAAVEALERTAEQGRQIEAGVSRALADQQTVRDQLTQAQEAWAEVEESIGDRCRSFDQGAAEASLLLDSLHSSEAAAFAVWRSLRDHDYDVVEYRREEDGIEVFLKNRDDRLVALQLKREGETGEEILLDLDLAGFDPVNESEHCDRQLAELLEDISDAVIICQTETEHPHRRRPGGQGQRVVAPRATRTETRTANSDRLRSR